jgi:hypothetical protein
VKSQLKVVHQLDPGKNQVVFINFMEIHRINNDSYNGTVLSPDRLDLQSNSIVKCVGFS